MTAMVPARSPRRPGDEVRVRVPGSTSNLGPGFDFLGLALGLFVELRATVVDGRDRERDVRHDVRGGAAPWGPEEDLVLQSLAAYESRFGARLPALRIEVSSEVPVGRGFGSSGAAVAATLLAAAAIDGRRDVLASREKDLVPLGVELEGHPDNSTASLLGGCTLAVPTEGGIAVVRQPVHESLAFVVAWPEAPLFTEASRAALPESVPHADAVENPRRLALLLEGLRTGDGRLVRLGLADRLHERFRRPLIPGSDEACAAALEAGAHGACLSGAGSGLVALAPRSECDAVARALAGPLEGGQGRPVAYVSDPPSVTGPGSASTPIPCEN